MTLALKLGRTLEELGRTMTSQEFALWLEVYPDDLWGEMMAYERAGIVASTVANYAGKMLRDDAEPLRPRDFMPLLRAAEPAEEEPDPVEFFKNVARHKQGLEHGHL